MTIFILNLTLSINVLVSLYYKIFIQNWTNRIYKDIIANINYKKQKHENKELRDKNLKSNNFNKLKLSSRTSVYSSIVIN